MYQLERLFFLTRNNEQHKSRYVSDLLLALLSALLITACIRLLDLAAIRNISLFYLFVVLLLAINRGLYAALCVSLFSFFVFDFFLVRPLYTFRISDPAEWLALFFFLATAIVTGIIASMLQQSVQDANRREDEARALYQLVSATANESDVRIQLKIVADTMQEVFAPSGVLHCSILLPQGGDIITYPSSNAHSITSEEETLRASVLQSGETRDLYDVSLVSNSSQLYLSRVTVRSTDTSQAPRRLIRLIPLKAGSRVIGLVRLVISDDPMIATDQKLTVNGSVPTPGQKHYVTIFERLTGVITGVKRERTVHQTSFFQSFINQTTAIIESARLRQESLQMEVLQRTDGLRAALLSSVSHDLRTPLSSIKAAAYSLQEKDVAWDEEERHSFAVTIEREADRLNRLVGNILDMSRIEGGALKAEKELYPLDELVYYVLDHLKFVLKDREIHISLPENLPPVALDFLQMDQVLTNLVENAVRYTPSGSAIEISAEEKNNEILISVADRGSGIPEEYRERIFDKFYRVMGVKQRGTMGTGLGLAVCRGLVEAHGGRIWVENRNDGGAVFRFTLPLTKTRELVV